MARIWMPGVDIDLNETPNHLARSSGSPGAITRDTSVKRTGNASWKCDSGSGTPGYAFVSNNTGTVPIGTITSNFYARGYFCFGSLPGAGSSQILRFYTQGAGTIGTTGVAAVVTSAGKFQLWNNTTGTQIGSDSTVTISADSTTWYRVEILANTNATSQTDTVELRVDGTTVASATGLAVTHGNQQVMLGVGTAPGGTTAFTMWVDDVSVNDGTGAANNSWLGDGKIILILPVADGAMGSGWLAGGGGSSNLYLGVDNTPPVGVAAASGTNTSQIKCNSTSFPSNANFFCPIWNSLIGASDTLNAGQIMIVHGEDPATGTKNGTLTSGNPSMTSSVSFAYGNDQGAQGTYPGLWAWSVSSILDAPNPNRAANFTFTISTTAGTTGTRTGSVCFVGAYFDYTSAAVAGPVVTSPYGDNFRVGMRRASTW